MIAMYVIEKALTTASSRPLGPCRFWKVSFNCEFINAQHRTSNKDTGEFMLRDRSAPLNYKIETPKVYSPSMLDVGCSMLDVHFLF